MSSHQEMRLGGKGIEESQCHQATFMFRVAEIGDNANRRLRAPFAITLHLGLVQFLLT